MSDVFKEQLIKHSPSNKEKAINIGAIIAAIIITIVGFTIIPSFGIFVAFAAGFGAYYVMGNTKIEYEYIFTNGELEIDAIFNKTRRKKVYTGHIKNFEIMAPANDKNYDHYFQNAVVTKDCSSGVNMDKSYAFLAILNGKKTKIIIEPNDVLVKSFSSFISPRVFIKRA